jgi:hypothetical protein
MSEAFEVIRGTGKVFRDLGYPNADAEHLKAVLAAQKRREDRRQAI